MYVFLEITYLLYKIIEYLNYLSLYVVYKKYKINILIKYILYHFNLFKNYNL